MRTTTTTADGMTYAGDGTNVFKRGRVSDGTTTAAKNYSHHARRLSVADRARMRDDHACRGRGWFDGPGSAVRVRVCGATPGRRYALPVKWRTNARNRVIIYYNIVRAVPTRTQYYDGHNLLR